VLPEVQPFDPDAPRCDTFDEPVPVTTEVVRSVPTRAADLSAGPHCECRIASWTTSGTQRRGAGNQPEEMSYLFGSGWWIVWHVLLWSSVAPYIVMTAALNRASPNDPMLTMETAFGVGTLGLVVLMGGTVASGYLWTAGGSPSGTWPYLRNIVGAVLLALIVGFVGVFGAAYMAVTPKQPMGSRWAAQLVCLGCTLLLLWFCTHAAWRFRQR
jgi:hypothetical protein